MKVCSSCKEEKSLDLNFRKVKMGKGTLVDGEYYSSHCRACDSKRSGEYNKKHRSRIKDRELQTRYGISLTEYNEMVLAINNTCPICGSSGTEKRPLVVDHCHITSKIRGLLCYKCNLGIGYLKDSSDNLTRASSYLRNFYGK